jgi:hypothetical protein
MIKWAFYESVLAMGSWNGHDASAVALGGALLGLAPLMPSVPCGDRGHRWALAHVISRLLRVRDLLDHQLPGLRRCGVNPLRFAHLSEPLTILKPENRPVM